MHYIHLDTVDSTNNWAKSHASTLDPTHITCITASEQTAGRGTRNKRWLSPKGTNIYATFFFGLPKEQPELQTLAQLLAFCCAQVLQDLHFSPHIKWPNDLLLSGKKVAGVLCEILSLETHLGIVLGIGINVNMTPSDLDTIDQPATSLEVESGRSWRFEEILIPLAERFTKDLALWKTEGFAPFATSLDL